MTIDQTFEDKKKEYKKLFKQLTKILRNTHDKVNLGMDEHSKLGTLKERMNKTRKNIEIMHKGTGSAVEIAEKINEIYSSLTDDEKKNLNEEMQSKK